MKNSSPKKKHLNKLSDRAYELNWNTKESREANLKFICGKLNEQVVSNFSKNKIGHWESSGSESNELGTKPRNTSNIYSLPTKKGVQNQGDDKHESELRSPKNMLGAAFGVQSNLEEIRDPYKKFIKAVELSPSMVIIVDRNGVIEFANAKFLESTDSKLNEVVGRGLEIFMSNHSSISTFEQLKAAVTKGDKWKGELVSTTKTGQTFIFSLSANPVENDFGFITNHVILGQDVTPFRETEKKLKNAVEEKSVLLSELHHRVKNNLAIISGLMQLQAFSEPDENVQSKLFSSVGRVQTMASMHELLYESGSFSKVEFGKNVKKIVSTTSKVYYDIGKDIKVKLDVESVKLNINQAHPCSLILNEVITNAYKHAFKGREQKAGKIYIQLYTQKNHVFISIVDNGIGLPSDLDVDTDNETQYLGTTLLKTLVSQLNGSYQYTSDCFGTTFTLNFKKEDVKGSASAGFTRS